MSKYPIFLELKDRRTLVIGGGTVALRKVEVLLSTGAKLVVVANEISDELKSLCGKSNSESIESKYSKDYLKAVKLVVAATDDNQLNKRIYEDCQELGILCNVVDQPPLCDFYVPAIVQRGDLQIAISTNGRCPAYAAFLRKKLEKSFTEKHGEFIVELDNIRKIIIEKVIPVDRKALLEKLVTDESFEYFSQNGAADWHNFADKIITEKYFLKKKGFYNDVS